MNESILCPGWVLASAGTSFPPKSNGRLPFIAQGDAYTGVETPTGGSNADVYYTTQKALMVLEWIL